MPKVSARFRNRKINFRTRISIHKGPIELSDEGEDEDFGYDDSGRQSAIASPRNASQNLVETGVDKEEESELHLQKVINASTAALLRSAVNRQYPTDPNIVSELSNTAANSSEAAIQPSGNQPSQNVPHIPIPDATGLVDPSAYEALYGKSKLFLPSSYIRFSDTVEDTLRAVIYTMDEEDQLWLGSFNSTQTQAIGPINPASNPAAYEESAKARRANARKGKEKERVAPDNEGPGRLSEDDFEALMDHFEKTTEETVPGLHLDINRLPSLADFEHTFESALINPRLPAIKIFAKFVYSHWKERRLKCGGRPIMPAVDFDESNESNPYVCFRRREIKMVRKTRRTDAQNMDRLVRLRNDLYKAHELLSAVLTRERVKREAVELEKVIFEGRCQIRDMKRRLNQPDGDEELLVSKREKRRKKEGSANGLLKSPHRKTTDLDENGPISGETAVQDTDVLKEHVRLSARFMDRELNRIREEQIGWEDFTDSGHQPINLSSAALRWRGTALSDHSPASRLIKEVASGTEQGSAPSISVLTHNQFRRRVGRGGRFLLDRILAPRQRTRDVTQINSRKAPEDSGEDDQRRRFVDRWRYDDDLRNDFPFVDDPQVIDDYDLPYSSRRRNLLDQDDQDCLNPHSETYLSQVLAYLNRVPEPHPPLVKVGKLPSKAVPNLLGSGLGRNHTGSGITTTLQEQILSVQAAAHLQGLGSNHQTTKRILSGVVAAASLGNINGSAQLRPPPMAMGHPLILYR
ncbi:enhancer of polycomb-like-domain-containing protein [Phakopsora pachyrhizi]|uniref:Enhancer of polycomb-like protein n=1 Tax=Phakopsora pachyrhizi TaxID=170000 RepID=A0AAV0AIZ5_PHAPC|nr:enhancer of polycomb-like-domain-containing protein [Phakopsora pachyrhizi]CAH7671193.1 enhancer of polycomb-like-domain-containing protein [Phakopsora pachyrhizi]